MHARKFGGLLCLLPWEHSRLQPDSFAADVNAASISHHLQQSPSPSDPNQYPNSPNNNPNGPNNNPGTPNNPNGLSKSAEGRNLKVSQPDRLNNPNQPNGQPNGPNDPGARIHLRILIPNRAILIPLAIPTVRVHRDNRTAPAHPGSQTPQILQAILVEATSRLALMRLADSSVVLAATEVQAGGGR